ncbi:hypothetical protein [Thiobacillus sp.]
MGSAPAQAGKADFLDQSRTYITSEIWPELVMEVLIVMNDDNRLPHQNIQLAEIRRLVQRFNSKELEASISDQIEKGAKRVRAVRPDG